MKFLIALAALSLSIPAFSTPALAQAEPNWLEAAHLVHMNKAERSWFYDYATTDCPRFCKRKAFVVKGDRLVAWQSHSGFTEVEFVNPNGAATRGWLRSADLDPDPGPKQALSFWQGNWKRVEADIRVSRGRTPGQIAIRGDATWGGHDPERVKRGAVNIGEIEAMVAPRGFALSFAIWEDQTLPYEDAGETGCGVRMRLMPPYLVVQDNYRCGGHNVSFTGIYRRAERTRK